MRSHQSSVPSVHVRSLVLGFGLALIMVSIFQHFFTLSKLKSSDGDYPSSTSIHRTNFLPVNLLFWVNGDPAPIMQRRDERSEITSSGKEHSLHATLNRSYCYEKYGAKAFITEDKALLPPMLYTFPGSGNTWSRLLIEHATGIYTGSVYNDPKLLESLPGEFTCDGRVSAIKVHPHTHEAQGLMSGTFNSDENKCKRGGVRWFRKAVLLIRDPFDSIWSEYQRRITQCHVSGIPQRAFDWHRWQANAAQMSHGYLDMWKKHYANLESNFTMSNVIYVRYEDLKNPHTRVQALGRLVEFLQIPSPPQYSNDRLTCAFILAENKQAHRKIDSTQMTKTLAYTSELSCRMWRLFGEYADKHEYTMYRSSEYIKAGFRCNEKLHPAIPRVNVGAQGEYDLRWVKQGEKLMDFGGYNKNKYN